MAAGGRFFGLLGKIGIGLAITGGIAQTALYNGIIVLFYIYLSILFYVILPCIPTLLFAFLTYFLYIRYFGTFSRRWSSCCYL